MRVKGLGTGREVGRDDDLEERLCEEPRGLFVDGSIEGDDAAKRAHGVALERARISFHGACARPLGHPHTAGHVVFDDDRGTRRVPQLVYKADCMLHVEHVVVRKFLAVKARQGR